MSDKKSAAKPASIDPLANVAGKIDTKREEEGDWFTHPPENGIAGPNHVDGHRHLIMDAAGNGMRAVLVRSRFTDEYRRAEEKYQNRAIRISQGKRIAFTRQATIDLTVRCCLVDWDFTSRGGDPIPFDRELAHRLMTEPDFRHHADFIALAVAKLQGDLEETLEDDEGN